MDEFAVCRRILVRLPTWVGDAVMVTPALRALRQRFRGATIIAQGRPHLDALLSGAGLYDDYLATDNRRDVERIRDCAPDLAIVFPHSFRSAWEVFRAGVPRRVGYCREGRSWLLSHGISPHRRLERAPLGKSWRAMWLGLEQRFSIARWRRRIAARPERLAWRRELEPVVPIPMVMQYLELVGVVGAVDDGGGTVLATGDALRAACHQRLTELGLDVERPYIAVNPGASFGSSKVYPLDLLAPAIAEIATTTQRALLVLCGPAEETLAQELCQRVRASGFDGKLVDTSVRLLPLDLVKVAIEDAQLLVTTDTGPWHIGGALRVPSVVLMGSTDPRYTASHQYRSRVLRRDVPCGPCHIRICPLGHHRCMREIEPRDVVAAARDVEARADVSSG